MRIKFQTSCGGGTETSTVSFPNPMDSVRLILYGLGLANSTCNPFIYFFNVGGKRTEGTQDLYLAISNGEGREGIL